MGLVDRFADSARRQGLSDGFHGYPDDAGDFDLICLGIYRRAHRVGSRLRARRMRSV